MDLTKQELFVSVHRRCTNCEDEFDHCFPCKQRIRIFMNALSLDDLLCLKQNYPQIRNLPLEFTNNAEITNTLVICNVARLTHWQKLKRYFQERDSHTSLEKQQNA